jgi:choline dehydrogenase-like flavoprotein
MARASSLTTCLLQDWGITYDELEPHFDRFEYVCGTSGQAGNIQGRKIEGGNPFEVPRSREFPGSGANGRIWPAMMSAELPVGWA